MNTSKKGRGIVVSNSYIKIAATQIWQSTCQFNVCQL